MYCIQCGYNLPDHAKFCPHCGLARQFVQQPPAGAAQQFVQQPPAGTAQQFVQQPPAGAAQQFVQQPPAGAAQQFVQQPPAGAAQQLMQQPPAGAAQQNTGYAFEQYKALIESRLGPGQYVPELNAWTYYSEEFKMKWGASKLKKYVFLANFECLNGSALQGYSAACMKHALKIYEGLPRGFQNGVCSFAIAASNIITPDAIAYVQRPAPAHFAAFEFSITADLVNRQICYMQKTPMWGALMWKDIRKFGSWCASFQ